MIFNIYLSFFSVMWRTDNQKLFLFNHLNPCCSRLLFSFFICLCFRRLKNIFLCPNPEDKVFVSVWTQLCRNEFFFLPFFDSNECLFPPTPTPHPHPGFQFIVECHGNTLLPQFLGMYRLTVDGVETYMVVTRNVFSHRLTVHRKYDLKVGDLFIETELQPLHYCWHLLRSKKKRISILC